MTGWPEADAEIFRSGLASDSAAKIWLDLSSAANYIFTNKQYFY